MNVATMGVTQEQAYSALREYKQHRSVYDKRDWEIERIYRQISKGETVISVNQSIVQAGIDELGRPRLAIMRADQHICRCEIYHDDKVVFRTDNRSRATDWYFEIPWVRRAVKNYTSLAAKLPRIPPQHRPAAADLAKYHILWEADWTAIPRDPYLLKRIGKDAWVVCAAWDLSPVEMSVMRSYL